MQTSLAYAQQLIHAKDLTEGEKLAAKVREELTACRMRHGVNTLEYAGRRGLLDGAAGHRDRRAGERTLQPFTQRLRQVLHLARIEDAVGIAVEPDVVAELGALQLDDQRLDRATRVNHRREERVSRQETAARSHRSLRHRHQLVCLRLTDNVAVVVVQESVIACRADLSVAVPQDLPDRNLDLAEVVLATVPWI